RRTGDAATIEATTFPVPSARDTPTNAIDINGGLVDDEDVMGRGIDLMAMPSGPEMAREFLEGGRQARSRHIKCRLERARLGAELGRDRGMQDCWGTCHPEDSVAIVASRHNRSLGEG